MSEPSPLVGVPRSILLQRVLGCLRDHCHDDTAGRIAWRLGLVSPDVVEAALQALREDRFVISAGRHWQLTSKGWESVRGQDRSIGVG